MPTDLTPEQLETAEGLAGKAMWDSLDTVLAKKMFPTLVAEVRRHRANKAERELDADALLAGEGE